jgi:hypothetical protein
MLKQKLAYYNLKKVDDAAVLERIASFPKKDFILDLRPFVPANERERLAGFFDLVQDQVRKVFAS